MELLYPGYVIAICVIITLLCTIWIPVGALLHFLFKWPDTSRLVGSSTAPADKGNPVIYSVDQSIAYKEPSAANGYPNETFVDHENVTSKKENLSYEAIDQL